MHLRIDVIICIRHSPDNSTDEDLPSSEMERLRNSENESHPCTGLAHHDALLLTEGLNHLLQRI
jgi:hypothetical protein